MLSADSLPALVADIFCSNKGSPRGLTGLTSEIGVQVVNTVSHCPSEFVLQSALQLWPVANS